ncbi:MAG: GDYXXLXY domain-containing protein [Betaproteobacteria bacterium]|nr:GDYXXLXY domain-containing protein [Betaproteobacteria bacterium]
MQRVIIALGLVLVLAAANLTVREREALIAEGAPLYLELAPVDPRSLMQGDYMRLRFAIDPLIWPGNRFGAMGQVLDRPPDGSAVIRRDARGVGVFDRIHKGEALGPGESLIQYRLRKHEVRIVTNAWFFQEGTAEQFARARYGEFRVAPNGQALLVALRDQDLQVLGKQNGQ